MFFIYISIKLQLSNLLNRFYYFFDKLVTALNIFTFFQEYNIEKKCTKTSKKMFCKKRF